MFGMEGTSILSAGVRWANFESTTIGQFYYRYSKYNGIFNGSSSTSFNRELHRTFNGVGPTISWKGSMPFEGSPFSLEGAASGAILFGRHSIHGFNSPDFSRGASVPQAGGYLGLGWMCPDWHLKFTAGYNIMASWNVLPQGYYDGDDFPHRGVNRITHGPFININYQIE
jgi:hypothetical protein